MIPIRSEKSYTPQDRAKQRKYKHRQRQLAGVRVHDLAALGKAILLCDDCTPKFNAAPVGYATNVKMPRARGQCDGCLNYTPAGVLFLKGGG